MGLWFLITIHKSQLLTQVSTADIGPTIVYATKSIIYATKSTAMPAFCGNSATPRLIQPLSTKTAERLTPPGTSSRPERVGGCRWGQVHATQKLICHSKQNVWYLCAKKGIEKQKVNNNITQSTSRDQSTVLSFEYLVKSR
jgi:hypothetical protein